MSSTFVAVDAAQYEQMMERRSRDLAALFIEFAGVRDGESVLDVGCGTGSLTYALLDAARGLRLTGIDQAPVFLDAARARPRPPRCASSKATRPRCPSRMRLRSRALLLVLQFVPDIPARARRDAPRREARRHRRPGHLGRRRRLSGAAPFRDTGACLLPSGEQGRKRAFSRPLSRKDEMRTVFVECGFCDVLDTSLTIRMNYAGFADYWGPIAAGEGPLGAFCQSSTPGKRRRSNEACAPPSKVARRTGRAASPPPPGLARDACRDRPRANP